MSSTIEDQTRRLEEKHSSFRGSAKIHLRHLQFNELEQRMLRGDFHLDQKNVARLNKIFEIQDCLRLESDHHVPAMISEKLLQLSIRASGLSNGGELLDRRIPPTLQLPPTTSLQCLHGRHRIAAARNFLLPDDKWWIVNLYSDRQYPSSQFNADFSLT